MILPKNIRKSIFSALGTIGYYSSSKYRNIAFQNLDFSFDGKLTHEEKKEITKYSFKNLSLNILHLMELRHMSKDEFSKIITFENLEVVKKIQEEGRAIIFITPHYSSWEFTGASVGAFIEPMGIVYKKLKNPTFQEWLLEARSNLGNINLEKTNVLKPLVKRIKSKKACGILIDTNINKNDGLEVIFMGKTITQTPTSAFLARKFNAAIIPVASSTEDEENYKVTFFDEIKIEKSDDEKADIQRASQLQADWLTKLITDEPKFWFWLHRRWKNDHPEIYV